MGSYSPEEIEEYNRFFEAELEVDAERARQRLAAPQPAAAVQTPAELDHPLIVYLDDDEGEGIETPEPDLNSRLGDQGGAIIYVRGNDGAGIETPRPDYSPTDDDYRRTFNAGDVERNFVANDVTSDIATDE